MKGHPILGFKVILVSFALLSVALVSCGGGGNGDPGPAGPSGSNEGTVTGTVTAPDGTTPLADVTVTSNIAGGSTKTDSAGKFSLFLPVGTHTLSFAKSGFTTATAQVTVAAAGTTSSVAGVALAESASGLPSVTIASDKNEVGYGNTVNVTATVTPGTNSSTFTYKWAITPPSAGSAQGLGKIAQDGTDPKKAVVTMPVMYDTASFRGAFDGTVTTINGRLYRTMPYEYTPTTDLKGGAAPAGTIVPADQNYVANLAPQTFTGAPKVIPISADTRGAVTMKLTVTDSLGGAVNVGMPSTSPLFAAAVQPGINSVAIGTRVYLNSGHASPWAWSLIAKPSGSAAALSSGTDQYPNFVPDLAGKYTVKEGSTTTDIWAGRFVGVIAGGSYTAKTFNLNNELDAEKSGMWYDTSATAYWASGATSATYTNWPVVTPDPGCTSCHANGVVVNGLTAPDNFTPWTQTAHANFFARGLEGITGNSGSCLTCHTSGYDLSSAANNGGFDDVAAAKGWTYPATRKSGNWAAMFSSGFGQVSKLSNIQCENCHGPQDTTGADGTSAHISGVKGSPTVAGGTRVNFSAEVCAVCHASGTGHHRYSEWLQLDPDTGYGHSNQARAVASGTNSSCGRCHSAEGYAQYVDQLKAGTIGSLTNVWWNTSKVNSVTCTACHDPHDASNPNQLRFFNETPLLPSGFKVAGLGKGALCISCHNSRNGANAIPNPSDATKPTSSTTATYLHEDAATMTGTNGTFYNDYHPTGFSAPHQACQGDVLSGRNAYFMSTALPMQSKHANVKDSCVGCHMVLNPQTHLSHGSAAVSDHAFFIRDQDKGKVCANCHGSTSGEAVVASAEANLLILKGKLEDKLKAVLGAATAGAPLYINYYVTDGNGTIVLDTRGNEVTPAAANTAALTPQLLTYDGTNPYTSVVLEEVHGQIGFLVTLTNNVTKTITSGTGANAVTASYTFKQFEVQLGAIFNKNNPTWPVKVADADTVFTRAGTMVRAGWNYFLVEGDQSKGIHNPTFVNSVLNNTIAQAPFTN